MTRATPSRSADDLFVILVFAQLTCRESPRDMEACLRVHRRTLDHAGIRGHLKRCNLAHANSHRDARLFADVAALLLRRPQRRYAGPPHEFGLIFSHLGAVFRRHRQ